ncbi:MAG: flagellar hook-associated protein FlgL [Actinomycetes bacterium]|jgi:flagellar hook-associated protein 3 FlgL
MSFRVTQGTLARGVLEGLQTNLTRLQRTQEQLSSGRRLNRPSDSPVDTVNAMQLRAEKARATQYGRNIDDGLSWLNTADTAMTQAYDMVDRVRQLAVQAGNAAMPQDSLDAMAKEVDQIRDGLKQLGNTQYAGKYIFAGTRTQTQPFDAKGVYVGNTSQVLRTVSSDPQSGEIGVNVNGSEVFGTLLSGGLDPADPSGNTAIKGVLENISDALKSGDRTALQGQLGQLDAAAAQMRSVQSTIGAKVNRLTGLQEVANARLDTVTQGLANAENIDLPKTIIDMQIQQNAYQAALGATAKIIQPSLMDFLR